MKRIDRLVLMELAAPWGFGVALFTVLLIAAGPLVKITSFLAAGAPAGEVGKLVALLLPAVLVKTFTMAMLLAGLLGFGRLSSDSEITALKAGGASVIRILRPGVPGLLPRGLGDVRVQRPRRARLRPHRRRDGQAVHRRGQDRGQGRSRTDHPQGPEDRAGQARGDDQRPQRRFRDEDPTQRGHHPLRRGTSGPRRSSSRRR